MGFNRDAPLAVVAADFPLAGIIGFLGFTGLAVLLYAWLFKRAREVS